MAFESLSDKLQNAFKNLKSKGRLTEDDVKDYEKDLQTVTDKRCKDIDKLTAEKEKELLTV